MRTKGVDSAEAAPPLPPGVVPVLLLLLLLLDAIALWQLPSVPYPSAQSQVAASVQIAFPLARGWLLNELGHAPSAARSPFLETEARCSLVCLCIPHRASKGGGKSNRYHHTRAHSQNCCRKKKQICRRCLAAADPRM